MSDSRLELKINLLTKSEKYHYRVNMSGGEGGGSLLNALKIKLLEEQKELQELRINLEKCQDDLKVETEKREEVNGRVPFGCMLSSAPLRAQGIRVGLNRLIRFLGGCC